MHIAILVCGWQKFVVTSVDENLALRALLFLLCHSFSTRTTKYACV